jgi:hypothetical protein
MDFPTNERLLLCGHTFCDQCINSFNTLQCPVCKKERPPGYHAYDNEVVWKIIRSLEYRRRKKNISSPDAAGLDQTSLHFVSRFIYYYVTNLVVI